MRLVRLSVLWLALAVALAGCGGGGGTAASGVPTALPTNGAEVVPTDIPTALPADAATAVSEAVNTAEAVVGAQPTDQSPDDPGTPPAVATGAITGGAPGVAPITKSGVVPSGWTPYTDATGQCSAAVPPGWSVAAGVAAGSPDGTVTIYLNGAPLRDQQEFESAKGLVKMNTPTGKVLQDDPQHLLLEVPPATQSEGVAYHYVANVGQASCYMILGISAGGAATNGRYAQQILESVGPGR